MSTEATAGAATRTWRYSVCDPPHPGVGGTHLCHLDPLTKTSRGSSSPTTPPAWKCCPRVLQGLHRHLLRRGLHPPPPLQSVGPWHRAPPQCQTPQREDIPSPPPSRRNLMSSSEREFGEQMNPPVEVSNQ